MKIGEFCRKNGVSVDTVRHYIDLDIILPEKRGAHYSFDASCQKDLEEVFRLKKLGFSLAEIQKVLAYKRLTDLRTASDMDYYDSFFDKKKHEMQRELDRIREAILELEAVSIRERPEEREENAVKLGLPVRFLGHVACPCCRHPLSLVRGDIADDMVIEGILKCRCGMELSIENGVLLGPPDGIDYSSYDGVVAQDFGEYNDKTHPKFVNSVYRSAVWMLDRTGLKENFYPVILELGTGSGFLLRRLSGDLPPDSLYIITDNAFDRIKETKAYLEHNSLHRNFAFICADFLELPIKYGCVDLVLDFGGSFCYNLKKEGYLIKSLDGLIRKGGKWAGGNWGFDPGAKSLLRVPGKCRPYLYRHNIIKSLRESRLTVLELEEAGTVDRAGGYESFLVEGDEAFGILYSGIKERE